MRKKRMRKGRRMRKRSWIRKREGEKGVGRGEKRRTNKRWRKRR